MLRKSVRVLEAVVLASIPMGLLGLSQSFAEEPPGFPQLETTEPPSYDVGAWPEPGAGSESNINLEKVGEEMHRRRAAANVEGSGGSQERGSAAFYLQGLAALALVLALIVLAGVILRRVGRRSALLGGMGLGQVLGRIYLMPRVSLHFVRAGGRVLVIGVAPNQVSVLAEFDAAAFEAAMEKEAPTKEKEQRPGVGNFFAHLKSRVRQSQGDLATIPADIAALRDDIQRLQEYLRETARREVDN